VDPETFKGIHHRLAELGGVVVDAVEEMRGTYFACKGVPYSYQNGRIYAGCAVEALLFVAGSCKDREVQVTSCLHAAVVLLFKVQCSKVNEALAKTILKFVFKIWQQCCTQSAFLVKTWSGLHEAQAVPQWPSAASFI
jgi:hypothetical protein